MNRVPTREKAQAIFERKLLAAEKQGTRCNLRGIVKGGCTHAEEVQCWAAIYTLVFKAMRYGRRRGLISVTDPWEDRSWMEKETRKP